MHTLAGKCIQIYREGTDKRLSFSCSHFCNITRVKCHTTNKLYIIVALSERTLCRFARECKCTRKYRIE